MRGIKKKLLSDLRALGLNTGDNIMAHVSLRRVGTTRNDHQYLLDAILETIGESGTLLTMPSWEHSPYDKTLNGKQLTKEQEDNWPIFNPTQDLPFPAWGYFNNLVCAHPSVARSNHPDASMAAIGSNANYLVKQHQLNYALGEGSPIERFIELNGKVALLGATLDAVTVLHFAEAKAKIKGKRTVSYKAPVLDDNGKRKWVEIVDWDTNGITDQFANLMNNGGMDAVETIARSYLLLERHKELVVGKAHSYLFDAKDLVNYGIKYLEQNFG